MTDGSTRRTQVPGLIYGFLCFMLWVCSPSISFAVLPPDVVVNVGAQVVGFFSLIVAVVISLCTSLGVLYFWWYDWCKRNAVYIAFLLLAIALVLSNAFYLWQLKTAEQISIDLSPIQTQPERPDYPPVVERSEEQKQATDCLACAFYSDSVTLFVPSLSRPLVLELDMNRRQEPDMSFTHYYFLDGVINANSVEQYVQHASEGFALYPASFLVDIQRTEADDASVRDVYSGIVLTETNEEVRFQTGELQGDFLTRNMPEYTQFQSVVSADVSLNGEQLTAFALVENLTSIDYEKRIFFAGYESLESLTYQFVLWDENKNFYMIDKSEVYSNTPQYPAHTWLLYKNHQTNQTQKGFRAEITEVSPNQWSVQLPDFDDATLDLTVQNQYQEERNGRSRYIVRGTITDSLGSRSISGLLRLVR